jgi:formyl-CoA transferase
MGNAHANLVPYQVFACVDGHVVVAVGSDGLFRSLCKGLGRPELADDPRFSTNPGRVRNRTDLISILNQIFATRPVAEWMTRLHAESVPIGPINDLAQVFADPHVRERQMVITVDHALAGTTPLVANPIRLPETPVAYDTAPPLLGQHTATVLSSLLSMNSEEIARLEQRKIVQQSIDVT